MDFALEAKIKQSEQGFTFEHSIASKPFFWSFPEIKSLAHMTCTHVFADKSGLESMSLLVEQLDSLPDMQERTWQKLHDFAFSTAQSHTFEKDTFSWTRGENENLTIDGQDLTFVRKTWDDGNEYRSISPSAYTYTWKVPAALLKPFFQFVKVESLPQLLSKFDGSDFFETRWALTKFSEANDQFERIEH